MWVFIYLFTITFIFKWQVLRRSSVSSDYVIPDGWHRLAIVDDEKEEGFDPWFNFIQELALRLDLST